MILWEIARATGLAAIALYSLTATWGILIAGRGIQQPKVALDLHRSLQTLGLLAIVTHIVALLLDHYAEVGPLTLLGVDDRPGVVIGAVALWLAAIIPLSFALRTRKRITYGAWRAIHFLAYGFWAAAVVHGIWSGTDTGNPIVLAGYGLIIAMVLSATAWRLLGGTPPKSKARAPRSKTPPKQPVVRPPVDERVPAGT